MARVLPAASSPAGSVERFFQFSLLGLLVSGYLAVAGSGYLDTPTVIAVALGLTMRALMIAGLILPHFSERQVATVAIAYIGFYPIDYLWVTGEFLPATVHLVFFLAVVKLLTARTDRDYFYLKIIAFLELLAAAMISSNLTFFIFLAAFLVFGVATFASGEVRRSANSAGAVVRGGLKSFSGRLSGLTVFATLGILLLTAGLFFLLPRTARAAFRHLVPERYHLTGFSNEVRLGQIGELKKSNSAVMHVRFYGGERQYRLKWRGTALSEFDGRRWYNQSRRDEALRVESGQVRLNPQSDQPRFGPYVSYQVHLNPIGTDALFLAGSPEFLQISTPIVFRTAVDGYRLGYPSAEGVRYVVYSFLGEAGPHQVRNLGLTRPLPLTPEQRRLYLRLPEVDPRTRRLALELGARETSDFARAIAVERHLRHGYGYTTELPAQLVEDPIAHFLFDRRKGHCEYFASAMAVLLRIQGIPARVVTGFQSGIYNPISGWHLIRASDAHSWVEAWMPDQGWITFEPTPPDPNPDRNPLLSRLSLYIDAAETFWQDWVLNYDVDRQFVLVNRFEQSRRKWNGNWLRTLQDTAEQWTSETGAWLKRMGPMLAFSVAVALGLVMGLPNVWAWWRARRHARRVLRGQASAADATVLYLRMLELLRRRGIEKPTWVTPAEFARQMPPTEASAVVKDLTLAYNDLRFGGRNKSAPEMVALLTQLEQTLQGR